MGLQLELFALIVEGGPKVMVPTATKRFPNLALGKVWGLQVERLEVLWAAELGSWNVLGFQVGLPDASKRSPKAPQWGPKAFPRAPKRSPKGPQGSPRASQELPKSSPRAHVDPKKYSKGCPRALKRRKERICKNNGFTVKNQGFSTSGTSRRALGRPSESV